MRAYELMVILDPEIDERTVAPSMEKYLQQVTAAKGTVENVDIWGKRRLAYDINKRSEGIYVVIDMTTTPDVALEITRQMNLNEAILRTKPDSWVGNQMKEKRVRRAIARALPDDFDRLDELFELVKARHEYR